VILPHRRFVVIRHGQTDANRNARIAGRLEAQLTAAGRAGALDLARWSWPSEIAVFSSPQTRARETADLAFPDHAITTLADLRERDWGIFEGRPIADLPPRFATPEGGEAWAAVLDRAARAVRLACEAAGDRLPVLVAHSGIIRALRHLTGGSAAGPTALNAWPNHFIPSGTPTTWRVEIPDWTETPWIA
jgi:broad specificity phosphatase PhoE